MSKMNIIQKYKSAIIILGGFAGVNTPSNFIEFKILIKNEKKQEAAAFRQRATRIKSTSSG